MTRQRIVTAVGARTTADTRASQGRRGPAWEGRPSGLARIFVVPDGEPIDARLAHIRELTAGERLWFEQGVRVGDRVLVPYQRLDDGKPAALSVDRLMRRLRCTPKEAFDLGEALLALDADAGVIAHYVGEARRRGVGPVLTELLAWAGRLGTLASGPDGDALDHAAPLGDAAEDVTEAGELAAAPSGTTDPDAVTTSEPATLTWRVLGTIDPPRVRCPRCGIGYMADEDAVELPACPRCGTSDTWEARQPAAFRALLGAIEACPTRPALADLGRRIYAARLPRGQAGVAWTRYRIRKAALDAAAPLSSVARGLLAEIEGAAAWALPRLGAALYRRQHAAGAPGLTPAEWRRIWTAYRARRPARPA